jgi:CheY-like chemotaxis protein
MLRRVIGENIDLRISLAPELGTVKADRSQMHQVLMNLAVNGQEAMPGGGALTIETRNVWRGATIRESPGEPGARPYTLLRISDTGIGMDDRTKKHLFEPFFTTKGVGRGAGLGLATVFGIVSQSDGHISVESEPGKGATFSIYLPCVEGALKADTASLCRREEYDGAGAALIVEDQDEVRRLVSHLMIDMGFEVITAASGTEGVVIAAGHPELRLLLTDVVMPGMNGRELAERLTRIRPDLKVIFMSGYTGQVMGEESMNAASVAYLQKPFTREALMRALRQVLG